MKEMYNFTVDICMAALMYYGLYVGNVYAENLFWPVLWVFVFMCVFVIIALSSDEVKSKMKINRKPRKAWKKKYSLVYDTVFSLCLAALGFAWAAAIWWIVQLFASACINNLDAEMVEENKQRS